MAEAAIAEFRNQTNITEANKITYGAKVGTPEGFAIAYGSLMLIAVLPIVFGSFRSASYLKKQKVSIFQTITCSTISDLLLKLYFLNSQLSGKNLDGNWTGALMLFGLYFLQCSQVFRKFIFKYYLDSYPHLVLVGFLQWCHQFSLHWLFLLFCYDFSDLFVEPHDYPIDAWFSPKEEVYLQLHQLPWIALCGHKYWHLCLVHPYQGDFLLILVTNYLHIIIF